MSKHSRHWHSICDNFSCRRRWVFLCSHCLFQTLHLYLFNFGKMFLTSSCAYWNKNACVVDDFFYYCLFWMLAIVTCD